MDAKPKRRWFNYSLRTLLAFVTIACAGFGWLGYKVHLAREQRAAVEVIRRLGGDVYYDDELPWCLIHGENSIANIPGPPWLRRWLGDDFFRTVTYVSRRPANRNRRFSGWKATDAELAWLEKLPQLKTLDLSYSRITDAGLVHLRRLKFLRDLDLSSTNITDAGLSHLKPLTQLETLALNELPLSAAGYVHLTDLKKLRSLTLIETPIGDADLAHIAKLNALTELSLGGSQVTDTGVEELQLALPNLTIHR